MFDYWTCLNIDFLSIAEISKVRINLFQLNGGKEPLVLPEEQGAAVDLTDKVYVPVKEYPDVSFCNKPVLKSDCARILFKTYH